jgi:hypothetical protein
MTAKDQFFVRAECGSYEFVRDASGKISGVNRQIDLTPRLGAGAPLAPRLQGQSAVTHTYSVFAVQECRENKVTRVTPLLVGIGLGLNLPQSIVGLDAAPCAVGPY